MNIRYTIEAAYKEKLRLAETREALDDLTSWPKVSFLFQEDSASSEIDIDPDISLSWLDHLTGVFSDPGIQEYRDVIWGLTCELSWREDVLQITEISTDSPSVILESHIGRQELFRLLKNLCVSIKHEFETVNPKVKNDRNWLAYYFVKHPFS